MRAMEGVEEAAGRGVSEAQRTLRLMVAGGLLLVACVLGLALSVLHATVTALSSSLPPPLLKGVV